MIGRKTCPTNRGLRHNKVDFLPFFVVGRLAPQIGDYDLTHTCEQNRLRVGRLAPQIGDYDPKSDRSYHVLRRKTCPTNRGLRQRKRDVIGVRVLSEDLPHKSGITTHYDNMSLGRVNVGRLAPQIGDYDPIELNMSAMFFCRKTCPTNRGLRPLFKSYFLITFRRKTCPTNHRLPRCIAR